MSVILRGGVSTALVDSDALRGLRTVKYPKAAPTYSVRATTGILAATLAAGSPIFAMRGSTAGTIAQYITKLHIGFSPTVTFTAAQQFLLDWGRFSVAAMAGGQAYTPVRHDAPGSATVATDIRAATTGALTTTGVTMETNYATLLGWGQITYPFQIGPIEIDLRDNPIVLRAGQGDGFAIYNRIVWPAAGTGIITAGVTWEEF